VDDHQLDIATHFAELGLVRRVTSETDLAPLLTPRGDVTGQRLGRGSAALRAAVSQAVAAKSGRRLRGRARGAWLAEGSSSWASRR
jgi:hypothetical protein